jgi:hypothetical protein
MAVALNCVIKSSLALTRACIDKPSMDSQGGHRNARKGPPGALFIQPGDELIAQTRPTGGPSCLRRKLPV